MRSRRGMSSGGGASSLGYLFGSDGAPLARPNNRAPPRLPQPPQVPGPTDDSTMQHQQFSEYNPPHSRSEQSPGSNTPTSGYNTPSGNPRSDYHAMPPLESNHRPSPMLHHQQSRAAGKVTNDGGGESEGRYNKYFRANGLTSGNFMITTRRVQAAPGGGSSLGYLFGGA